MNKYYESILNSLGYSVEEDEKGKITGIKCRENNNPLNMNYNSFNGENIEIHLKERKLVGTELSLDDDEREESKEIIRERCIANSESDIMDITFGKKDNYYFHCYRRQSTGSYNIILESKERTGYFSPVLVTKKERIAVAYQKGVHGELNMSPLTIAMSGNDKGLYVIINGYRGESICIYPMDTNFMLCSSKTKTPNMISLENFDEAVSNIFNEQFSDSPIYSILMRAFEQIMPAIKLFIADNNKFFKAFQERQEQLAIVQRELLIFDEKYAACRNADESNKEEARKELEVQLDKTQKMLIELDDKIAKVKEFYEPKEDRKGGAK